MKRVRWTLRGKLILSFSIVIIFGVFASLFVGVELIGDTVLRQAQDKVRLDLNSAREVYQQEHKNVETILRLTAVRYFLKDAILRNDWVP